MKEIWKDIVGYEKKYQVSNLGRVKSLNYGCRNIEKIMKLSELCIPNKKYLYVGLRNNGKQKCYKVHRLVAMAFIPNPENKPQVNHIDGNKQNNRVDNLEWCTNQENCIHAIKTGLVNPRGNNYGKFGIKHHNAKKIYQIDIKTKKIINTFYGCYEAERETGVYKIDINHCCRGRLKTAGGYIWRYANENI